MNVVTSGGSGAPGRLFTAMYAGLSAVPATRTSSGDFIMSPAN